MKKIRTIITIIISLAFSAEMFYCFQAGAPAQNGTIPVYTIVSAIYSLAVPAAITACCAYIRYLQKKLEETMQNQEKTQQTENKNKKQK